MRQQKKEASHVPRLREVLECAVWLLLWQRRSFFGSLRSDVVQMYPLLQAIGLVRFFRPSVAGSKSKQPCFLMRQSRLACGNLTKPAAVRPLHSALAPQGAAALRRPRNRGTSEGCFNLWDMATLRGCALLPESTVKFFSGGCAGVIPRGLIVAVFSALSAFLYLFWTFCYYVAPTWPR